MIFKITEPLTNYANATGAGAIGDYMYPVPGTANADSRMFVICGVRGSMEIDEVACRAVYHTVCDAVNVGYSEAKPFTEDTFDEALKSAYDVLESIDADDGIKCDDVSLALVLLHRGGCFVAVSGDAQVVIVRPGKGLIYSANKADSHAKENSKMRSLPAVTTNLTDLQGGDYIYIGCDSMPSDDIVRSIGDKETSDTEKLQMLKSVAGEGACRREYLVHITQVQAEGDELHGKVVSKKPQFGGPLAVAITTVALALWFILVYAVASYLIDYYEL